jgi:hypothetical protein
MLATTIAATIGVAGLMPHPEVARETGAPAHAGA